MRGRGLLYAYGAHNAQASCPLAANVPILPSTLAVAPFDVVDEEKNAGVPDDNTAEEGGAAEQEWEGTITAQDAEKWGLSLTEPVHNLFLSRHTCARGGLGFSVDGSRSCARGVEQAKALG